ncbi:hypothetical protein B0H10DRAFT_2060472 [Mycena sp. CBHHK59/15]|nr:hypothetical protein B0H10DRAFT_2060472 [Mycena sp. CBHHK59/15]
MSRIAGESSRLTTTRKTKRRDGATSISAAISLQDPIPIEPAHATPSQNPHVCSHSLGGIQIALVCAIIRVVV